MSEGRSSGVRYSREGHGPGPKIIERCVAAWQRARAALANDGELASDETLLVVALEADPNILPPDELLRRMVAAIVWCEARGAEAHAMAKAMQARQQRYEARAMWLRTELLEVMLALERSSFAGSPFATASVRDAPASSVVLDETKIPDEYFVTTRKLDRRLLLADLRQGLVIDGAVLSNPALTLALIKPKALQAPEPEQVEE